MKAMWAAVHLCSIYPENGTLTRLLWKHVRLAMQMTHHFFQPVCKKSSQTMSGFGPI